MSLYNEKYCPILRHSYLNRHLKTHQTSIAENRIKLKIKN